jgi:F-type H+-transporting ATPase subunit gamma
MPSTRDIRRRIRSVRNTAQITKAMQMVAAAKMRKAQQAALAGRPYAALMNDVLANAAARTAVFKHPLLEVRPIRKRAVILVSTDRGLCGALNSNLFREAAKSDPNTTTALPGPFPNLRRICSSRARWTRWIFCSPITFRP